MNPIKPMVAILTVLAFSASLVNAAPQSKDKGYTVQQTSAVHQNRFQIGYLGRFG